MGPTETLRKTAETGYEKAIFTNTVEKNREVAAMIQLEFGLLYHYYMDSIRSREYFLKAQEISGLVTQLSGAMGRRTKFQSFDLPQLVLLAKSKESTPIENQSVPESIQNPDPDAPQLENIKFTEALPDSEANLSVLDQCIVLALCLDVKNRNPRHGLTWEEMRVYVERVLKNPNNWTVYSMGLLIRARLEFEKTSTMDKACMQIQVLVDQHSNDLEKDTSVAVRMKYIHLVAYPPQILMKKELGQKWLTIGSAASAQKLFEELEMWEEIVDCYVVRNMRDEAEALIRKCLEKEPSPRLWCTLGDLTGNFDYYEKSWELSQHRFTRAKRSLGKLAMQQQKFDEAIRHLEDALRVNPQYGDAWFRLGCCALAVNNYNLAHQAFSRVVQLHPDDGESWNNLASVNVKRGKNKHALKSLKEAVKYKNQSWQIWENILLISMDLGELNDSIYAMDNILELKDNYVDTTALSLLVKLITTDIRKVNQNQGLSCIKN
jgi:tetratricopeptide (TPR) repeat protein